MNLKEAFQAQNKIGELMTYITLVLCQDLKQIKMRIL